MYSKHKFIITFSLVLLFKTISGFAGTLTNASVTPASLITGVTTTYTIQFDAASAISTSNYLRFVTSSGGANVDNATVQSSSPIGVTCTGCSATQAFMTINSGSVSPGQTVTIVLENVLNPIAAGQGPSYSIQLEDNSYQDVDTATVSGSVYVANQGPVVTNPIPNQTIEAQFGAQAVDLDSSMNVNTDLDYTFTDGNGDNMTFTIVPGHDTNVVTASVVNDELILTGQDTGNTSVTVQATSVDGFITDTFDVTNYGTLAPGTVTPASFIAGDTTQYTITFQPATVIDSGDFIILTSESGTQNHTGSTLVSLSGGLSGTRSAGSAIHTVIWLNGGSAGPGDTVTVVLGNIVNPGAAGQSPDYRLRTTDGSSTTGTIDITGTTYTSADVPTVANLIPNQSLFEEDGSQVTDLESGAGVSTDLNYTFVDGDGDPLTFSIDLGHDTNVVTAAVVSDELILTGTGTGSTTVTVRADDNDDGSVTTSFEVSVVGDLLPTSVTPSSLFAGESESYVITFSPATPLDSGDFIIFSTSAGGPDQTSSTLDQLSGSSLTGSITAGGQNSTVVMFDGGSASTSDTITVVLGNILNPATPGQSPDYIVRTTNGSNTTGQSTLSGDVFIASDLIFEDGFDGLSPFNKLALEVVKYINSSTNPPLGLSYNSSFRQFELLGAQTSRDDFGQMKSFDEILSWVESVMKFHMPLDDTDGDGIFNVDDDNPLNL